MNLSAAIQSVGVLAPGLDDWSQARPVLAGHRNWQQHDIPKYNPSMLPANERRRLTTLIRAALKVAQEALEASTADVQTLSSVFASSDGDLYIIDTLCRALSEPDKIVSPTLFHNSVHNAPAGYWSIGHGSCEATTSISAGDGSFIAGLLEAVVQVTLNRAPVLLVAYDVPPPAPLDAHRYIRMPFAVAMVLDSAERGAMARLSLNYAERLGGESRCHQVALESVRCDNPAARSLPLLEALASGAGMQLRFDYDQASQIELTLHEQTR